MNEGSLPTTSGSQSVLSPIEEILEDMQNGRMVVLVDAEDRENEGDLVIPAQMATPDAINFMARHGRGLICLAMPGPRIDALGLPLMSTNNASRHETAFTVSIEAREGVTTGISAYDRARTVAVAMTIWCARPRFRSSIPHSVARGRCASSPTRPAAASTSSFPRAISPCPNPSSCGCMR